MLFRSHFQVPVGSASAASALLTITSDSRQAAALTNCFIARPPKMMGMPVARTVNLHVPLEFRTSRDAMQIGWLAPADLSVDHLDGAGANDKTATHITRKGKHPAESPDSERANGRSPTDSITAEDSTNDPRQQNSRQQKSRQVQSTVHFQSFAAAC